MKFDVVIGNPPFQGQHKKASKLWPRFYELGISLLKEDGMLTFVAPATWLNRRPRGAWKYLADWDITAIVSDAAKWFPNVASSFAIPTIYNRPYGGTTLVDKEFEVNLHEDALPYDNTQLTLENIEFLKKMSAKQLQLDVKMGGSIPIDDPRLSLEKTETHIYETYYSSAANRRSIWCSEPQGDHGKLKLIVGLYGNIEKTPEITTKAAGAKSRYVLGTQEELEQIMELLLLPENRRWVSLMQTDAFSNPLTYISKL